MLNLFLCCMQIPCIRELEFDGCKYCYVVMGNNAVLLTFLCRGHHKYPSDFLIM